MVDIDIRKEGKLDNTQKTLPMCADATWDDPLTFLLNMSNEDFESIINNQFFEDIEEKQKTKTPTGETRIVKSESTDDVSTYNPEQEKDEVLGASGYATLTTMYESRVEIVTQFVNGQYAPDKARKLTEEDDIMEEKINEKSTAYLMTKELDTVENHIDALKKKLD